MGSWEVPARGFADCGRQAGADQSVEQLVCLDAASMWGGSVGGSGKLRPPGPGASLHTLHHRAPYTMLFTKLSTVQNRYQGLRYATKQGNINLHEISTLF